MIEDADAGFRIHILSHDLCFPETDGESEVSTRLAEMSHELLEFLSWVGNDSCVVCKEEVMQAFQLDLGLCSESEEVEELSIWSGSEIDAFCGRTEGVFQHYSKEDSE